MNKYDKATIKAVGSGITKSTKAAMKAAALIKNNPRKIIGGAALVTYLKSGLNDTPDEQRAQMMLENHRNL